MCKKWILIFLWGIVSAWSMKRNVIWPIHIAFEFYKRDNRVYHKNQNKGLNQQAYRKMTASSQKEHIPAVIKGHRHFSFGGSVLPEWALLFFKDLFDIYTDHNFFLCYRTWPVFFFFLSNVKVIHFGHELQKTKNVIHGKYILHTKNRVIHIYKKN